MSIKRMAVVILLGGLMGSLSTNAETITIPVGQQAPAKHNLARPTRGMSQDAVLDQYGLPESKTAAVGEPPISFWRYPDYTVYFESETVIHSVLTHTPQVSPEQLDPH
jgi:hypothetical protein